MSKVIAAAVAAAVGSTPFDTLLTELDTLAKAHAPEKEDSEEDKKIAAAAAKKKEEEEKGGEGEMRKSFTVKLSDGTDLEVEDGSELVKALSTRFDANEEKVLKSLEACVFVITNQGAMLKSLTDKLTAQETTVKEQDTLIKSLRADLTKIGSAGAGRKTVLSVVEREGQTATTNLAKSGMPEGVTADTFFAKALDMQKAGKITGSDISLAEACLNLGQPVPPQIVQRVLS
jgi:hypothetical protein